MPLLSMEERTIDISRLKREFAKKFPENPLTYVLLSEPDSLKASEFIAKAQTWLSFLHGGKEDGKE